jgi:hypothetical protein
VPDRPWWFPSLAALAIVLAAAPAAAAAPQTETESAGTVTATLTYEKQSDFEYTGMRLQVTRAGAPAYDGIASASGCGVPYCAPRGAVGGASSSLKLTDLDGDGEPEVLVDLYSGGAHCCSITRVLRWNGKAYVSTTRNFADPGYTLDGATFVTADARFGYAWASFADSAFPVQLLTFGARGWRDVTRAHRDTLRADAARWLKEYKQRRSGTRALGVLAAWVADEYRLGRRAAADRFLNAELRAGRLKGERPWPRGKAYISSLKGRLKAWGYLSGA